MRYSTITSQLSVKIMLKNDFILLVVTQYYDIDVNKQYAIRGNAAILKCEIPSFVADFVQVVSWHTDQKETFFPEAPEGKPQHFFPLPVPIF